MIGTKDAPIVDTDMDELRARIASARDRFNRLIRVADPNARPPRSEWNVQQVVAHVLTVAQRYEAFIKVGDFRRAAHPSDLPALNQIEMEAVIAPIPDLAQRLDAIAPLIDSFFGSITPEALNERIYTFHFGVPVSPALAATNWLSELLFHGQDIARAIGAPWDMPDRDMLLGLRGSIEVAPAYLSAHVSPSTAICVAYDVRGARPFVIDIHGGVLKAHVRQESDRPDVLIKSPAETLMAVLYQRIGPFAAMRKGMRVIGGRRPWRVLKLQSYFESA